jgi:hypothetical protein
MASFRFDGTPLGLRDVGFSQVNLVQGVPLSPPALMVSNGVVTNVVFGTGTSYVALEYVGTELGASFSVICGSEAQSIITVPVVIGTDAYVSAVNRVCMYSHISASPVTPTWVYPSSSGAALTVAAGSVFTMGSMTASGSLLRRLSAADGSLVWASALGLDLDAFRAPVIIGDTVAVGRAASTQVIFFAINDGEEIRMVGIDGQMVTQPTVAGTVTLVMGLGDSRLYTDSQPSIKWSLLLGDTPTTAVVVSPRGIAYVAGKLPSLVSLEMRSSVLSLSPQTAALIPTGTSITITGVSLEAAFIRTWLCRVSGVLSTPTTPVILAQEDGATTNSPGALVCTTPPARDIGTSLLAIDLVDATPADRTLERINTRQIGYLRLVPPPPQVSAVVPGLRYYG